MLTPFDLTMIGVILVALVILTLVTSLGNERQRHAMLQVRDVARDFALSQVALTREELARDIQFGGEPQVLGALSQIALDAAQQRFQLIAPVEVHTSPVIAIVVGATSGEQLLFTPSTGAVKRVVRQQQRQGAIVKLPYRRGAKVYRVDALNSNPMVIEELQAMARFLAVGAPVTFPRTEHWDVVVLPAVTFELPRLRRLRLPSISLARSSR